jgi:hypothetical protein
VTSGVKNAPLSDVTCLSGRIHVTKEGIAYTDLKMHEYYRTENFTVFLERSIPVLVVKRKMFTLNYHLQDVKVCCQMQSLDTPA